MLNSLWRRLMKCNPISSKGNDLPNGRRPFFRPKLEALEDRTLPAPFVYGMLPVAVEGTPFGVYAPPPYEPIAIPTAGDLGGLEPMDNEPSSMPASQMSMMIMENSPQTVIDLDPIFTEMSGLHPEDGLQLSLLGNTNPGLVKSDLSGGELTLAYTPSQCGTATITVGGTDADGVCEQENIVVTVVPLPPTALGAASPTPISQQRPIPPSMSSCSAALASMPSTAPISQQMPIPPSMSSFA